MKSCEALALLRHLLCDGARDLRPVDGVDGVEEGDGLLRLVGLQRANQVQLDAGIALLQRRPFALRLLHAVLAEPAVAGVENRHNALRPEGLGDGDQIDGSRVAAGRVRGRRHARNDAGEAGCLIFRHGCERAP